MSNKIKLGFVGGGNDSLIGVLHKVAAVMFDRYHLVGGVFSSNKDVNWSLSGIDSNLFEISNNGALSFVNSPDYEFPAGGENDDSNAYNLTINAKDDDNNTVSSDLIISVL